MAKFQLTDKSGATYEIDAPDEHAAVAALGQVTNGVQQPPAPAAPAASKGVLQTVDDYVRAAANGATFGLADRFAAGMGSLTGVGGQSGDYAGNLQNEQAKTDQFATDHPIASIGANLAGGAVVPLGAIGAAAKGASLGAKTLLGMGAGAGLGTVQGALSSRDLTDLPQTGREAIKGALLGGTIGAAIPGAGNLIGKGYNGLANMVNGSAQGMSRAATGHLVSAAEADGLPAVQAQIARLGPDATLADAGPAFLGKAQGASLNSDEGRSVLQSALTSRNEGTNSRIMGDVNRALGPAEDPQTVTNAIKAYRSELDNVAYPAALGNAPPVQIGHILDQANSYIPQTVGMEQKAVQNIRDMISKPAPPPAAPTTPAPAASLPATPPSSVAADVAAIRAKYGDAAADAYQKQQQPAIQTAPSLLEFLATKGGLGHDAELGAIGAQSHVVNVDGVGRRKLVKQGGMPLDSAREAAEEAGYLSGNNGATSTPREFLDLIDAELRGQKRYPAGYEGLETKRGSAARSEREQHEYDSHIQGLNDDLTNAGYGGIGQNVRERAVGLMEKEGIDADTAFDRAMTQLNNESKAASPTAPPKAAPGRVAKDDASVLHKVKQELDNVIEYDAPGLGVPAGALKNQQGSLKTYRGGINSALEEQVPGYLEANRQSAALARRGQAVELGTQYLGSGKTTASPERFSNEFNRLEPGEQIAFAKGSRGNIERVLGTKANDLQALRSELQGEGGWNTAKIATVHGQDAADQLVGTVDRNLKFRDTYNKVVENSQTAQRQAAASAMKPTPATETPFLGPGSTVAGMTVTAAKKAATGIINAITRSDPTKSYGEVARLLSAQGPQRDTIVNALSDAMMRRQSNAAMAPKVGDRAALISAILGNAYARSGPRGMPERR